MSGQKGSKHITKAERIKIEALHTNGKTVKEIADYLHRDRSTIYKELKRGYWQRLDGEYRFHTAYSADIAQQDYDYKATAKGAPLKIGNNLAFANYLESKIIEEKFSPCAALAETKKQGFETNICFKTLYNYIDSRIFRKLTNKHLPCKSKRKPKNEKGKKRNSHPFGLSIDKRPKSANNRQFGHWEMDTVLGKRDGQHNALLVLTERKTRYEIILQMAQKTTQNVVKSINDLERKCGAKFKSIFKTITVDNGREFCDTQGMEQSCRTKQKRTTIYYCHPYSSWERGSNENANILIRRFIPKGTPIENYTNEQVKQIETWINRYPRKILNYNCSYDLFMEELAKL